MYRHVHELSYLCFGFTEFYNSYVDEKLFVTKNDVTHAHIHMLDLWRSSSKEMTSYIIHAD